jgi:hypothetical protein
LSLRRCSLLRKEERKNALLLEMALDLLPVTDEAALSFAREESFSLVLVFPTTR